MFFDLRADPLSNPLLKTAFSLGSVNTSSAWNGLALRKAEGLLQDIVLHRSHAIAIQAPLVQILVGFEQLDAHLGNELLQRWICLSGRMLARA